MARNSRNGQRTRRENNQKRIPVLGYYIILTDGTETEQQYFDGLRNSLPEEVKKKLVLKVFNRDTKKLIASCKEIMSLNPNYAEPWIVFDRDKVVDFDMLIRNAERESINVAWSNPCIEVWFEAYFNEMSTYLDSVTCNAGFRRTFSKRTGQKYLKSNGHNYRLLCQNGSESDAIRRAKLKHKEHLNNMKNNSSEMIPCSLLYILVEEIRLKAHSQI